MGLGFLLAGGKAGRYRLGFSGEVHPIYAATLRSNHVAFSRAHKGYRIVPDEIAPIDLRSARSLPVIEERMRTLW